MELTIIKIIRRIIDYFNTPCNLPYDCPFCTGARSCKIASGMEYINTGVSKQAIGIPTDEERKKLKEDGYTLMSSYTAKDPAESYEIWLK